MQKEEKYSFYSSIPIYKDYHKIVASLCSEYSLKELSYIYQLYGVLEECYKIVEFYWNGKSENIIIRNSYRNVLEKIYGENYPKILSQNIDNVSYKELYNDPLMKEGYRKILNSLDEICNMEN